MQLKNAFKTSKSLAWAIDNPDKVDGMSQYLDNNFAYHYFDTDDEDEISEIFFGKPFDIPYWLDMSYDEKYRAQYRLGYYEPCNYGDVINICGNAYRYVTSFSLPEEEEHQMPNGDYVYEHRGYSYLRILKQLTSE